MLSLSKQNHYRERYRAMHPGWRTSGEVYESLVRRHIHPNATVLDLGCGAGGVMELFSGEVALAVGVDPHLPSLRHSRDRCTRHAQAIADSLPFRDTTFDLIVCSWVLEHVIEPRRVFAEISRVLKLGGHFVFLTPNADNYVTRINRLAPRLAQVRLVKALYGRSEDDTFEVAYRANRPAALRSLASEAGLVVTSLTLVHDPTYLAFNNLAFRLSTAIEARLDDVRAVHIVGEMHKATPLVPSPTARRE